MDIREKVRSGKPHPLLARSNFFKNSLGFTAFLKAVIEHSKKQ